MTKHASSSKTLIITVLSIVTILATVSVIAVVSMMNNFHLMGGTKPSDEFDVLTINDTIVLNESAVIVFDGESNIIASQNNCLILSPNICSPNFTGDVNLYDGSLFVYSDIYLSGYLLNMDGTPHVCCNGSSSGQLFTVLIVNESIIMHGSVLDFGNDAAIYHDPDASCIMMDADTCFNGAVIFKNDTQNIFDSNIHVGGDFLLPNGSIHPCCIAPETSVLTNDGDMLYFQSGKQRLPIGTINQILMVDSSELPTWTTFYHTNLSDIGINSHEFIDFFIENTQTWIISTNETIFNNNQEISNINGTILMLQENMVELINNISICNEEITLIQQNITLIQTTPTFKNVTVEESMIVGTDLIVINDLLSSNGEIHPCCTGEHFDILKEKGDLLVFNSSGQNDRLLVGSQYKVLMSIDEMPTWSTVSHSNLTNIGNYSHEEIDLFIDTINQLVDQDVTTFSTPIFGNITMSGLLYTPGGTVHPCCSGGVNLNSSSENVLTTNGDLLYYLFGDERLPIGSNGQHLTVSAGLPSWQTGNHQSLLNIGINTHDQIDTHIASTIAHGATGAVVGTTNVQTLESKTIDSLSNTLTVSGVNVNSLLNQDVRTTSTPSFVGMTLSDTPTIDNTQNQILVRDSVSGLVKYRSDITTNNGVQTLTGKTIDSNDNTIQISGVSLGDFLDQSVKKQFFTTIRGSDSFW